MELHLFVFHDDVEEFCVSAYDKEDAFDVIEEQFGSDAADDLIMSRLSCYSDSQEFTDANGDAKTAKQIADAGRGILMWERPGGIKKPA